MTTPANQSTANTNAPEPQAGVLNSQSERPFHQIVQMLARASEDSRHFPPTLLYNEGWLLRLILDWFCTTATQGHALSFAPGARWFSEARLASRYMARAGSPASRAQAEGFTHADGVVGHFELRSVDRSDAVLSATASQFLVTEAKLGSALSAGTKNAPEFDQAARNVACMAHLCSKHSVRAEQLQSFGFYVLAPESRIADKVFAAQLRKDGLLEKVTSRENAFPPNSPDGWIDNWFRPLLDKMTVAALSWESLLHFLKQRDAEYGLELERFYKLCLKFNNVDVEPKIL